MVEMEIAYLNICTSRLSVQAGVNLMNIVTCCGKGPNDGSIQRELADSKNQFSET